MKNKILKIILSFSLGIILSLFCNGTKAVIFAENRQIPLIDYSNTIKLDDFNFNQNTIFSEKENEYSQSLLKKSQIKYRISNRNSSKLCVEDGKLVFKGVEIEDDYINFETQTSYDIYNKTYMVIKILLDNQASLKNLSFSLDNQNFVKYDDLKMDNEQSVLNTDIYNPYYDNNSGYYYLVIDVVESSLCKKGDNLNTLSINYNGSGRVYIDEIFYTDKLDNLILEEVLIDDTFSLTQNQVQYFANFSNEFEDSKFNQLSMKISMNEFGKNLDSLVLEIDSEKYASIERENYKTIILTENKTFKDINFDNIEDITLTVDLLKMGIKSAKNFNIYADFDETGVITISNIKFLNTLTNDTYIIDNSTTLKSVLVDNFSTNSNENLLGEISFENSQILTYNHIIFDVYGNNIDLSKLTVKSENQTLNFVTNIDTLETIQDNKTILCYIDLNSLDKLQIRNNGLQFYYNFSGATISILNVCLANVMSSYQYIVDNFEVYPYIDNISPKVEIYNAPNFEIVGNNNILTIDYNADVNNDGDVATVEIILTDSNGITQYGDAQKKSFKVSEGIYNLTILVTDLNENVGKASITIIVTTKVINNGDNLNNNQDNNNIKINTTIIIVAIVSVVVLVLGIILVIIIIKKKKEPFGKIKF